MFKSVIAAGKDNPLCKSKVVLHSPLGIRRYGIHKLSSESNILAPLRKIMSHSIRLLSLVSNELGVSIHRSEIGEAIDYGLRWVQSVL